MHSPQGRELTPTAPDRPAADGPLTGLTVVFTGTLTRMGRKEAQLIAERGGVTFVNDSKATNVDAAAKALAAFPRIRWICGGLEKEGGLGALKGATGAVVKAYVIGREAAAFALQLDVETEICTTMARAVARAVAEAVPGDTVLLAPAASSFDQYDNFERRGEDFTARVRGALGRAGG